MASYEHDQIVRAINQIDVPPTGGEEHSSWIGAEAHLQLLRQNARASEIVIYASSRSTYIHAAIAKESEVTPPDIDDLLNWHSNPYIPRAGYSWTGNTRDVRVEFANTNPIPMRRR